MVTHGSRMLSQASGMVTHESGMLSDDSVKGHADTSLLTEAHGIGTEARDWRMIRRAAGRYSSENLETNSVRGLTASGSPVFCRARRDW